ncbi:hypothetical protein BUALT_Bualt02G0061700 [Buddleja alternifolia]|uniref:ENTH domain-containing protein n=1 Tax=Buddleja alternifolia TaxID=168488 RepID=A0AAV6XZG2_9LAMI|nr:hypothetical protein BUALT_Bualt02G0061700 [Buddleja alternifolia]
MSILSSSGNMNGPIFHEFKKQASFFLKEKIKTARLALTDVTQAQLLTEEATNGNPGGPDARTLKMISKAAFEIDDYWRIVDILHKRNWRASYKAAIVIEHLLTHGPERVAEEFQCDGDVIRQMEYFQHIDDNGFNWGENVRKKCERILKLLEKGPLLKQERDRARKVSRGIQGFGSFCIRTQEIESSLKSFDRCKSEFSDQTTNHEDFFSVPNENNLAKTETEKLLLVANPKSENSKENMAPVESKPLLGEQKDGGGVNMSTGSCHPFDDNDEHLTVMSLLSPAPHLKAC